MLYTGKSSLNIQNVIYKKLKRKKEVKGKELSTNWNIHLIHHVILQVEYMHTFHLPNLLQLCHMKVTFKVSKPRNVQSYPNT